MSCLTAYVFNNQPVTVLFDKENNPWFKGKDVADILGYSNCKKALLMHVSEQFKSTEPEVGGTQTGSHLSYNDSKIVFISEPGLYELIFASRQPAAKQFKYWVFEQVLPSIRKYGEYKLKSENQNLLNALTQSLETGRQLQIMNESLSKENQSLNATFTTLSRANQSMSDTLTKQAPKVAVIPKDESLQHVFCVLIKDTMLERYGVCEYKCIRTEKRCFHRALAKAKNEGFVPCFIKSPVPNGVNILNRAKEVMKDKCMHFDSAFNTILTPHNFVNIVQHVIDQV
jgi:prophage antirepressor-like protein